ncbi:hypothetical protein LSUE1_G001766, partial [Lachnellula suecica]
MLAVQRPSMGSSKPPNLDMPFGYSFDANNSTYPFPSPTAPAPGPSLLDDNESKFLDSFFDGVSSDQFDYSLFSHAPDGADSGFGWDELPPTFMGTRSSFGQQPQVGSHEVPELNFNSMNMNTQVKAESFIPPVTSVDVLAAAALLQNGPNGRSHSMGDGSLFQGQDVPIPPTNGPMRTQSMSQYPPRGPYLINTGRTSNEHYPGDPSFVDAIFGTGNGSIRTRSNQKEDIRWGSDAQFGASAGFVSPTDPDKEIERVQNQTLENAFSLDRELPSGDNSRPPSPSNNSKLHRRTKSLGQPTDDAEQDSRPPKKRRKSRFPDEGEEDDESPISASQPYRKRKSTKKCVSDSPTVEISTDSKRRKSTAVGFSAAAAAKAARENLTEDQKRENHIKSEQKRRTLIREGFEDLGELVPGLRGGGFSKSAVLIMAADWLEELIQGNEVLKGRLDQMEG